MSDKEKNDALASLYQTDAKKAKRAPRQKRKKRRKNEPVSLFHRPIVCPPDGAGKELPIRITGYAARILLLIFAVFGFSFFVADAFYFHYSLEKVSNRGEITYIDTPVTGTIFLFAVLSVLVLSAVCLFRIVRRVAAGVSAAALLGVGIAAIASPTFGEKLLAIPKTLFNCFLDRLHRAHYLTLVPKLENAEAGLSEEFRVKAAAVLLTVAVAAVLVPCLIRKARIVAPTIFVSTVLTFIFVCNLSRSNWAFAILTASFAAVIVMATYDGLYQGKPRAEEYDTTAELFPEHDRPVLSEESQEALNARATRRTERENARAERRAKRKEARAEKKRKPAVTVDRELSDYYFADGKAKKERPARPAAVRLTPAEKRAEKEAKAKASKRARLEAGAKKKRIRESVEAVRAYDRTVEDSRAAAGGLAALAVFLLLMLVLLLPAISVDGSFKTIPAIDERLEYVREYLTALLVGDQDVLDELDYEKNADNFRPHSVVLSDRYYDGSAYAYVRARAAQNLYMKQWIGVDFKNDNWHAVGKETVEAYRELYGLDDLPGEKIRSDFYRTIYANDVVSPLAEHKNWLTDVYFAPSYGVILQQVSVERLSGESGPAVLFPYSYISDYGLRGFESAEEKELNFINYFDGILTGKEFRGEEVSYSVLSYTTTMKSAQFMETLSGGITVYNANLTIYELYRDGYFTDPDVNPAVVIEYDKDVSISIATYEPLGVKITTRYEGRKDLTEITVETSEKTPDISLVKAYLTTMTKAEKRDVEEMFEGYSAYREFVFDTYRKPAVTVSEDGAETKSTVLGTLSASLAEEFSDSIAELNEGYSFSAEAYEDRHAYIMAILDYMKENCIYIEPDEETLDIVIDRESLVEDASLGAIENFLTVTKQGYCVQFASALCLLLREQGIPARYVEGYVASELSADRSIRDLVYEGYVMDYGFHAWVEVWYDGIGWVQYEATTGYYYNMMYPVDEVKPLPPDDDDDDDPIPPDNGSEEEEEEEEEEKEMTDEEKQAYEEELRRRERIRKLIRFGIVSLCVLAVLGVVFLIYRLAAQREKKRDLLIGRAKSGEYPDSERRYVALALIDEATDLLALYGLAPLPGELHSDYAKRLFDVMPSVFGVLPHIEGDDSVTPASFSYEMDAEKILLSIDAEEFGNGISRAELKELAEFYSRLRTQKKRFIAPVRRFFLHYFGHKI